MHLLHDEQACIHRSFEEWEYAALQLENYIGTDGTKCWLKINYKYPY